MQKFRDTLLERMCNIMDKNANDIAREAKYPTCESEYTAIPTHASLIIELFERCESFFKSSNPRAFAIVDVGSGMGSALAALYQCGISTGAVHVKLFGIEKHIELVKISRKFLENIGVPIHNVEMEVSDVRSEAGDIDLLGVLNRAQFPASVTTGQNIVFISRLFRPSEWQLQLEHFVFEYSKVGTIFIMPISVSSKFASDLELQNLKKKYGVIKIATDLFFKEKKGTIGKQD